MRFSVFSILLALGQTIHADCGWQLEGNDCICMNSSNGTAWTEWTTYCCNAMGQKTRGKVRPLTLITSLRIPFGAESVLP
jgi:hypothetical protein